MVWSTRIDSSYQKNALVLSPSTWNCTERNHKSCNRLYSDQETQNGVSSDTLNAIESVGLEKYGKVIAIRK